MVYRSAVNRVAAGRVGGGRFTYKTHGESTVELEDAPAVDTYSLLASDTKPVNLITVASDEYLSNTEINDALAGKWKSVDESVEDSFSGPRYAAAYTRACDEVDAAYEQGRFHKTALDLDEEEVSQAVLAVMEKDTAAPTATLLDQTPPQLMRSSLGRPADRMGDHADRFNGDSFHDEIVLRERVRVVGGILSEHGIPSEDEGAREAIHELVVNGPPCWDEKVKLDVIWRGNVNEATVCPRGEEENGWREVTFSSPDVVLIDPRSGEGHLVTVPGNLRQSLTPDNPAFLDASGTHGYGWEAGSGYNPAVTSPETTDWI